MVDDKTEKTVDKRYNDEVTGKFVEDNPGRPKGQKNYLTLLEEALEAEAKKAGVSYWEQIAKWSFVNPMMASTVLKKFLADKEKIEHSTDGPLEIEIKRADAEDNS